MKKRISLAVAILFFILYISAFCFSRNWAKKPTIKYYNNTESFFYDGIEYTLDAEILDESELMNKYNVPEDYLASTVYVKPFNSYKYIVIHRRLKRVSNSTLKYHEHSLVSKYVIAGGWSDVSDYLNNGVNTYPEELQVNEEMTDYCVYIVKNFDISKSLDVKKQTYYYEFSDYEDHEYLQWLRIIN